MLYFNMLKQEKKSLQEEHPAFREAEKLERSGLYEAAAQKYERLGDHFKDERFYDKARELRDRVRSSQVKITSIDVNELIRQLKESGGAVAYRCTNCGAGLKINGDTKSPDKCEYCGSTIENLPDLLKTILH
jgi:rubrerythrin